MRTIFLLLILFKSSGLVGQIDSADKALIWKLIQNEQSTNQIAYADALSTEIIDLLTFHLNRDRIVGIDQNRRNIYIPLNASDKRNIQIKLDSLKLFKWPKNLLGNSTMIPADNIWEYVALRNSQFKDIYLSAVDRNDTSILWYPEIRSL